MTGGGRIALGLGATLAVLTSAALLTERGDGGQEARANRYVLLTRAPQGPVQPFPSVAPTRAAYPSEPSAALQDAGIWSTPAQFGPSE